LSVCPLTLFWFLVDMTKSSIIRCKTILVWICLFITLPGYTQIKDHKISGYVYDSVGLAPMANVNISVKGTKQGMTTNRSGFFKIMLSDPHTVLHVSHMGYIARELAVEPSTQSPLKVYLTPEIKSLGEVTVFNDKFQNILEGDSLKVLDYEIWHDRLLIIAQSANDSLKQRIYLTSLGGYIYSYRNVKDIGKPVKFPDEPVARKIYLFRDSYGEIQLLARNRVWQIFLKNNSIYLIYPSKYEDCVKYLFPVKCRLNNKLFFQNADERCNATFFMIRGTDTIKRVKMIADEFGKTRYFRQRAVKAPLIVYNQQVVLFNFFKNEIEFFNAQGRSVRKVPTMFHTKWYYDPLGKKSYDLDAVNFTQEIVLDQVTNKVYSIWRKAITGRYTLKELDLDTGEIVREIAIPDHPFIDKVLINDNRVYFMFRDREEQKYKSLYTMAI
jgi:hypothetical protein